MVTDFCRSIVLTSLDGFERFYKMVHALLYGVLSLLER